MLPPGLQTPREVTLYYDDLYNSLVESGHVVPFLYPWAGIGAFLVFGYLMIDHRNSSFLKWLRYPIFAFLMAYQTWCILTNRAKHPAAAFGVGLLSAWGALWVGVIMVVKDCQVDFVRIERTQHTRRNNETAREMNGVVSNGSTVPSVKTTANQMDSLLATSSQADSERVDPLYWQPYPSAFLSRIDWVADVFCSFRGVGWNWQTSVVPPLPKSVASRIHGKVDETSMESMTVSRAGIRRFSDRTTLMKEALWKVAIGYLALDVIKTLMHRDAYFWGYVEAAAPTYLPMIIQKSDVLVKSYRLLISLAGMYTALAQIFSCGPLFFCGVLGPRWIGVRGEPWMNPADMFGSFKCVLDHGLAGWWGGWWHQTFRYSFETPAARLLEYLKVDKRSKAGRLISLLIAFFLSGCVHAAGSYTQLGDTTPLMGPMRFFLLQPVGIVFQVFVRSQLQRAGIPQRSPKLVKQLTNFVFVHAWLYFTGPLLVDDFAKGGIWLFEPIPISLLRGGLRLGAKDDGWFCWWNGALFWRSGKHWWDTGIAI